MEKHEQGCTLNPNRVCGMCKLLGNKSTPIENLVNMVRGLSPSDDDAIRRYREFAGHCPACMLAGLRFAHKNDDQEFYVTFGGAFKWKDEAERFWNEINTHRREAEEFSTY